MEFIETDTQTLLRDTADRLVREKYTFENRKQIVSDQGGFSSGFWSELASLGLLGVEIDEDHGGSAGSFADLAVILEALGAGMVVEPYLSSIVMAGGLLGGAASQSQKETLLPKLAAGEARIALAVHEPSGRYDSNHCETTATEVDGGWRLNGEKAVVLDGAGAGHVIVSARTSGANTEAQGISLFLVPRDTDGVSATDYSNMDDRPAAELAFKDVQVPPDALIGNEGKAAPLIDAMLDRANAALCCDALGAMNALNTITLEYLKTREQFGRPIGKFQVLQHRMADMMLAEQSARSMTHLAIAHADNPDAKERAKNMSAAKVQIINSAREVGRGSIQLHGGIGMTDEYVAGHYFRRLSSIERMFGDLDWHLDRFAALS